MVEVNKLVHEYKRVKANKCDNQYLIDGQLQKSTFLTERIKVEAFQGFSNASNLGEYFRLRGATSWKGGEQVTGLWKTDYPHIYYGDRRTKKGKTLILFLYGTNKDTITIQTFSDGYYPNINTIRNLVKNLS